MQVIKDILYKNRREMWLIWSIIVLIIIFLILNSNVALADDNLNSQEETNKLLREIVKNTQNLKQEENLFDKFIGGISDTMFKGLIIVTALTVLAYCWLSIGTIYWFLTTFVNDDGSLKK